MEVEVVWGSWLVSFLYHILNLYLQTVLNCCRLLTRVVPYILEVKISRATNLLWSLQQSILKPYKTLQQSAKNIKYFFVFSGPGLEIFLLVANSGWVKLEISSESESWDEISSESESWKEMRAQLHFNSPKNELNILQKVEICVWKHSLQAKARAMTATHLPIPFYRPCQICSSVQVAWMVSGSPTHKRVGKPD